MRFNTVKNRKLIINILAYMSVSVIVLSIIMTGSFKSMENWFMDFLVVHEKQIDNRIKIIAIDDKSLSEIGNFSDWTRVQAADFLNSFDEDYSPAVVGFDINFFGERDTLGDTAFVNAVSRFDVITASYINYNKTVEIKNDIYYVKKSNINGIEIPFDALNKISSHGFSNTIQDKDNYIRRSIYKVNNNDMTEYNFAYKVYQVYMQKTGQKNYDPVCDQNNIYGFDYTAKSGKYDIYSFTDIINGRYDMKVFKDSIVLVGAYASGMMDQYQVPIEKDSIMNGVEVQANHINALLDERTYHTMNIWLQAVFTLAGLIGCFLMIKNRNIIVNVVSVLALIILYNGFTYILYIKGIYMQSFIFTVSAIVLMILNIIVKYFTENKNKRKVLKVLSQYIAPQVVEELSSKRDFNIELGGISKEVVVLFIDIRGFTAMSEKMEPKQVVELLNEYLLVVTNNIFKNNGMLDKFIGDAVMAIYNAPIDLYDYNKKAVDTAIDILNDIEKMNENIYKKFGCTLKCGIGIHKGEAIIGNIGCEYRMDYTAIGDTVNTAERLESIAKPGEILISCEVYEQIKNYFNCEEYGDVSLKGKKETIKIYRVVNQ